MAQVKQQIIYRQKNNGVGILLLDAPGKVNLLTKAVLQELTVRLDQVEKQPDLKALVLVSGKAHTFLSGADLHEILKFENEAAAYELAKQGQAVLSRLSRLGKPVVVGINGSCLGGGLELSLWCHKRIATTSSSTQLALPEVNLGLIPGLGGTQKLPRLIGVKKALEVILSSQPFSAQTASELGLVDKLVHPDLLLEELESAALELSAAGCWSVPDSPPDPKDDKLFALAERSVRIRTRGHYPAHSRVLEVMRQGLSQGLEAGLKLEAQTFAELALSHTAKNLIFLFFSKEMASQMAVSQASKLSLPRLSCAGVVGGGPLGNGLAALVSGAGIPVLHKPSRQPGPKQSLEAAQPGLEPVDSYERLAQADVVLEAVNEDIELKARVFQDLQKVVGADCLLTSNTSGLSLGDLASRVGHNQRLLGLHFFHPVDKMQLVEVIPHARTSRQALYRALSLVVQLGKIPVVVKDSPGFLVNRLLCVYLLQAACLAGEGTPLNWLEEAAVAFGMPMGPLALMDEVGLDIAFKVAALLHQSLGDRFAPPPVLEQTRALGLLGKKAGSGIYCWDDNGRRLSLNPGLIEPLKLTVSNQEPDEATKARINDRLFLPMLNEAAECLKERIVRRAREIDLAMVYGIGFPPFRGGPLRYADSLGITRLKAGLENIYAPRHPRPEISQLIYHLESTGGSFYSRARVRES